jgi:hypothetical protein
MMKNDLPQGRLQSRGVLTIFYIKMGNQFKMEEEATHKPARRTL